MNDYQQEQWDALKLTRKTLSSLSDHELELLKNRIQLYLDFRSKVDRFLQTHFADHCNQSCYSNRRSACCSKDGIVTFWADVVINTLNSSPTVLSELEHSLVNPLYDHKCTYLGPTGCCWQVRPLMCAMFLCDEVQISVFHNEHNHLKQHWQSLFDEAKGFRWPDRPVLFDWLETYFMSRGVHCSLMYINTTPGLLRIKQKAGFI